MSLFSSHEESELSSKKRESNMNAKQILEELKPLGKESYKRVLVNNHGVKEPCFGVSVAELKKIQKRTGTDYQLALDLYDTGNYDAMYLADLIADDARIPIGELRHPVVAGPIGRDGVGRQPPATRELVEVGAGVGALVERVELQSRRGED